MVENAAERRRALSTGKAKQNAIQRGAPQNDTAIINASELNKLMKIIKGPSTDAQARQENLQHQQLQAQKSAEHKMRLLEIDETRRSKGIAPSMDEIEKEELKRLERSQAKHKMEEELDEVKYMNKIMLYAKCVTVRDAQLAEKAQIKAEEHEESRHLDLIMEAERQRALKAYQEREVKRTIDRKKGAAVIRAQIEEREQERLRQLELKQQEQEAMLRHIVRMKEEDKVESLKKKEAAQKLMEQVALSNAEQIRVKNRQREQELEEDQRIAAYLREKERREQELQHEQELLRAEKEKEIARLRSLQEKAQDKQAEMDALRARRAQEAREREWRQKEAEAVRRQQAINNDLAQARERQKLEKELLLAEQARVEHEEFGRIVSIKLDEEYRERQIQEEEKAKRRAHAEELKRQIQQIEESRKNERRAFLEEGEKLKAQRKAEREKIEAIRHRKMTELEHLAVPVKYRSDLVKRRELEPLRPVK